MQSGQKDGHQGGTTQGNRVYPLTDVDDGNISSHNVGPGGMVSADEFSDKFSEKPKPPQKSRIQIVGYDQDPIPIP